MRSPNISTRRSHLSYIRQIRSNGPGNRAWTDFVPDFSKGLSAAYRRETVAEMEAGRADAEKVLAKLEEAIANERGNEGPYFNGDRLCLVDAAYAPFLQRFMIAEAKLNTGFA